MLRFEARVAQQNLALPREVDRLAEDAGGFLRRVKTGRVLCLDEIEPELRLPLQPPHALEPGIRPAGGGRRPAPLSCRQ
jgi:hypothetical protein